MIMSYLICVIEWQIYYIKNKRVVSSLHYYSKYLKMGGLRICTIIFLLFFEMMFTGALLEVAQEILIVWWAFCVIMLFFVLLRSLICVMRVSRLIGNIRQSYKQIISITQIPVAVIQKLLTTITSDTEEE